MNNTILITGSTSGIGKATALSLALMNHHIIIHGRNDAVCQRIVNEIKKRSKNQKIDYICADLSNLLEVQQLAFNVKNRFPALNILINNAGTFSLDQKLTGDNLEYTWVVNYLSRFLLTNLLLDLLTQNAPSRIVDISGAYHKKGIIHFNDINLSDSYSMSKANNQSKLANVLFTYKLARMLEGTKVTINTLHPGAVNTGAILKDKGFSVLTQWMYRLLSLFFKSPQQGAETSVYLATSSDINGVNGKFFVNKKPVESSLLSYDETLQNQLWEFSEQLIERNAGINICCL